MIDTICAVLLLLYNPIAKRSIYCKYLHCFLFMQIDVYEDQLGGCVAFLANVDAKEDKLITFRNITYSVPPWSVSILPDCKNVVFNTARVCFPSCYPLCVYIIVKDS